MLFPLRVYEKSIIIMERKKKRKNEIGWGKLTKGRVRSHQTKRKACNCNKNTGKNKSRGMTLYCNCKSNKGPLMGGIEGAPRLAGQEGVIPAEDRGPSSENRSMPIAQCPVPIGVRSPNGAATAGQLGQKHKNQSRVAFANSVQH